MHRRTLFLLGLAMTVLAGVLFSCSPDLSGPGDDVQEDPRPELSLTVPVKANRLDGDGSLLTDPIRILVLDSLQHPVTGVDLRFTITSGAGRLYATDGEGQELTFTTDVNGSAGPRWRIAPGAENRLDVTLVEEAYRAESLFLYPWTRDGEEVLLLAFRWQPGNIIEFPYTHPPWTIPHDGRVLESNRFLTFSDASSDSIRIAFARQAEESMSEIFTAMEVDDPTGLGGLMLWPTVKIYTKKKSDQYNEQYTFSYGFLLYGIDSYPRLNLWPPRSVERFDNEIKHEVMHMVQYIYGVPYQMCPDWLMEGTAEYVSGGAFSPITTVAELDDWLAHPDHQVHPLDVRSISDYPEPYARTSGEYYPAFHLIVEYLMADAGLGRSLADVREMFRDLAAGRDFTAAFQEHMGISEGELRATLFDRLRAYRGGLSSP
jgi:hypothetical protein